MLAQDFRRNTSDMRRMVVSILIVSFTGSCRTTVGAFVGTVGVVSNGTGIVMMSTHVDTDRQYTTGLLLVLGAFVAYGVAGWALMPETRGSSGGYGGGGAGSASASTTTSSESPARTPGQPANVYHRNGAYAGRRDAEGVHFYDSSSSPAGRVDANGGYYDATGVPAGRRESNAYYDRNGVPAGRIDPNSGAIFDRNGVPAGRIDAAGNIFDASGAPAGRTDAPCDAACQRDLAGRLLLGH